MSFVCSFKIKDPNFIVSIGNLGGGFIYSLLSPLLGEDSQFDFFEL